jgi:uncharacterized membrane protein YhaH (DUF805 family)
MTPISWALRPFKRYADFKGRASRAEYWWFALTVGVTGLLLGFLDAALLHARAYGNYGPLGLSFTLACIVPGLAVLVRRLHDTDRSGWWALVRIPSYAFLLVGGSPLQAQTVIKLLPTPIFVVAALIWGVVGFAVFLFLVSEGDGEPNRYGPDPYGPDELQQVFA